MVKTLLNRRLAQKTPSKTLHPLTPKENALFDGSLIINELVEMLKNELKQKDLQLNEKDNQIREHQGIIKDLTVALENTTQSLNTAQALHAGTIKQSLLEGKEKTSLFSKLFRRK